ncbi:MAG: hypothetical protein CMI53_00080 [Parcubacteria group bacterium]|jgi:thiol-disulfide isomerase/thioredoxin|nr:hypothetical protein [Parcubacteria group bacterium]|tara:strand:- start:9946 stop:10509 length:564 start_codon:yes stop_codon:yes gene_type:complete
MNKNYLIIAIVIVVVIIGGVVLYNGDSTNNNQNTNSGATTNNQPVVKEPKQDKAPAFSLQDYEGNTVSSTDFAGKSLIVNSWASWCPFCVDELPDFATIQSEFKDDIVIIAINRVESISTAKGFSDKLGVSGKLVLLLDPGDSFYQSIGGFSMPETIFVDTEGNIVEHKRGIMSLSQIRSKVNQYFK